VSATSATIAHAVSLGRRHGGWLWVLTGLFTLRVTAQPAALLIEHPLLPRFEAWHNGAVPYGLLVASQIVILAFMVGTSWRVTNGTAQASRRVGLLLLGTGGVYCGSMAMRLALGLNLLAESRWFASWLPTLFHLVLASFLLVVGHYHLRYGGRRAVGRNR
jgi:hypothetical protein